METMTGSGSGRPMHSATTSTPINSAVGPGFRYNQEMPPVFLVGFMGCGKTSVAGALADRMAWPSIDLDHEIERRNGRRIAEIFAESGEAAFRQLEAECLTRWLKADRAVVATGGGLFAVASNRRRIRESGGFSIFLDVPWPVLRQRIEAGGVHHRPMYTGAEESRMLFEARLPSYREADVILGLSGQEAPAEVADLICREMMAGVRCAT